MVYPNHRAYYEDKKFHVFDPNFQKTEDYLLKEFKQAIDSQIDYKSNAKLEHVDTFDKTKVNLKGINFQNAPQVNHSVLAQNLKYTSNNLNDPNTKVTSSDPYGTIFGGYAQ